MKIKTSELIGPALDWAVAKCEGFTEFEFWHTGSVTTRYMNGTTVCHGYSTNWSQGGPIVDREITGVDLVSDWKGVKKWSARRFEYLPDDQTRCVEQVGPTLLIAGLRCYVASKLGDEVEIPEELV